MSQIQNDGEMVDVAEIDFLVINLVVFTNFPIRSDFGTIFSSAKRFNLLSFAFIQDIGKIKDGEFWIFICLFQ
jgi:hypothetical protein